jgi:hypothetical protein
MRWQLWNAAAARNWTPVVAAEGTCSQRVASELMRERGVEVQIEVVPTGVDIAHFGSGDAQSFRDAEGLTRS